MSKTEPMWWSLFAVGGVVSAMLMPVTIFVIGIGVSLGWVAPDHLFALIQNPIAKLFLLVLISLSLFHGAHRTLFTLIDLGMKKIRGPLSVLLHTTAIVGTILAGYLLINIKPDSVKPRQERIQAAR